VDGTERDRSGRGRRGGGLPRTNALRSDVKDPLAPLCDIVREAAARLRIPRGAPLVLAVSGGPDSMAMLIAGARLAPEMGWDLTVAHLDHALRAESADDARFVADAAAALGLSCQTRRTDVAALAAGNGEGLEEAGRKARYALFEEVAESIGPGALVLTAHTADDQVETILLHLARGSGLAGLRGIAERRGKLVRPLLRARRTELRQALDAAGIAYRDDPTNADRTFARNRARADLVPALERLHAGAIPSVTRLVRLLADDDDLLEAMAASALASRRRPDGRVDWSDPPPRALARRALRQAVGEPAPSVERIDALDAAARGSRGGTTVELGGGRTATVRRHAITFASRAE
jgi:tRNA(Ile)-lysidine synthetase-like protein